MSKHEYPGQVPIPDKGAETLRPSTLSELSAPARFPVLKSCRSQPDPRELGKSGSRNSCIKLFEIDPPLHSGE